VRQLDDGLRHESAAARRWDCVFGPRRGHGYLSLMGVVFCQVEISATGRSLVQRSPTKCVCVCDQVQQ